MTLAYVVYFGLMLSLMAIWASASRVATQAPARAKSAGVHAAIATTVLFTAVIGGRYDVGGDYWGYIYYYNSTTLADRPSDVVFEPGFLYLIQILRIFDAPDRSIIMASSFIQISFLSYWLYGEKRISPFVVLFFFTIVLLDTNNAVRQGIALFASIIAIDRIQRDKLMPFVGWIFVGYLFHRSALIMIPLGLVLWKIPLPSRWLQISVVAVSYVLVHTFVDQVIALFSWMSPIFGYESYSDIDRADLAFAVGQRTNNLGQYLWPIIDGIIILNYKRLSDFYSESSYRLFHGVFLVAAILQPVALVWDFLPFGRALFYFTAMRMICLGFLVHYCLSESKSARDHLVGWGISVTFIVWLAVAVARGAANSAPYQF